MTVIGLRPHHFMCLPGYKGYNYDKEQQTSWDVISKQLNDNPDTDIVILSGKDDLCKKCPNDGRHGNATCREDSVSALDKKVQDLIGVAAGEVYKYSEIMRRMKWVMTPEVHKDLCSTCSWWNKGLCHDTFDKDKQENKAPFLSVTVGGKIDPSTLRYDPTKQFEKVA